MQAVSQLGLQSYNVELWNSALGEWPLYPFAVEESIRNAMLSSSQNDCPMMIVGLMLDGELDYRCSGGVAFTAKTGDLLVIPMGSDYVFKSRGHYHKLVLELKGALLPTLCEMLRIPRPFATKLPNPDIFKTDIRMLGELVKEGKREDIELALSKSFALLIRLSLLEKEWREPDLNLLFQAQSRLELASGEGLGIAELASELGVCQSMLSRLFKRELGISPVKYRIRRKMEKAMWLLSNTMLPIKEISARLAYSNQLNFSGDFKRHCGISPKRYRETHAARTTTVK